MLTARADNFLCGRADLDDTIRRLAAFAQAGADVLYAPGLPDMESIRRVVRAVAPTPVNVLIGPGAPLAELGVAGVRRVSLGGAFIGSRWARSRAPPPPCKRGILPRPFRARCPGGTSKAC